MPDIAMCFSETCSLRKTCYRNPESGTKPSDWQTMFAPEIEGKKCEYYWEID